MDIKKDIFDLKKITKKTALEYLETLYNDIEKNEMEDVEKSFLIKSTYRYFLNLKTGKKVKSGLDLLGLFVAKGDYMRSSLVMVKDGVGYVTDSYRALRLKGLNVVNGCYYNGVLNDTDIDNFPDIINLNFDYTTYLSDTFNLGDYEITISPKKIKVIVIKSEKFDYNLIADFTKNAKDIVFEVNGGMLHLSGDFSGLKASFLLMKIA